MNKRKKLLIASFITIALFSLCFFAQRVGIEDKIDTSITVLNQETQTKEQIPVYNTISPTLKGVTEENIIQEWENTAELELIRNECLTPFRCEAEFTLTPTKDYNLEKEKVVLTNYLSKGKVNNLEIYEKSCKNIPVYNVYSECETLTREVYSSKNDTTIMEDYTECETITDGIDYYREDCEIERVKDFNLIDKEKRTYIIKGSVNPNTVTDWIIDIDGYKPNWAWWDSAYDCRINLTATEDRGMARTYAFIDYNINPSEDWSTCTAPYNHSVVLVERIAGVDTFREITTQIHNYTLDGSNLMTSFNLAFQENFTVSEERSYELYVKNTDSNPNYANPFTLTRTVGHAKSAYRINSSISQIAYIFDDDMFLTEIQSIIDGVVMTKYSEAEGGMGPGFSGSDATYNTASNKETLSDLLYNTYNDGAVFREFNLSMKGVLISFKVFAYSNYVDMTIRSHNASFTSKRVKIPSYAGDQSASYWDSIHEWDGSEISSDAVYDATRSYFASIDAGSDYDLSIAFDSTAFNNDVYKANFGTGWVMQNGITTAGNGHSWDGTEVTYRMAITKNDGSPAGAEAILIANESYQDLLFPIVITLGTEEAANVAPTQPVWNAPANNSEINNNQYFLNWTNSTDANGDTITYNIQIDNDPTFSSVDQANSSITETTTPTGYWVIGLADGTYYARVRGSDGIVNGTYSTTLNWTQDTGVSVTAVTPTNNTYYTTSDNTFNCSSNGSLNVETVTLEIDSFWNYSKIHGTSTDVSFEINRTLTDGVHNYSCTANNSISSATSNLVTFTIDSTEPVINLTNYPGSPNITNNAPQNFTFNWTVDDTSTITSWLSYNGINYTGILVGTDYGINIGINNGTNIIRIYANDSVGNVVFRTVNITLYWLNITAQFPAETYETSIENFNLTLNIPAVYTFSSANLVYNGTTYASTTSTTDGKLTAINTINIPLISAAGNKTFYWNISFIETNLITDTYSHLVSKTVAINITSNCTAGLTKVFNFNFKTETNLSTVNAETVDYLFKYGLGGNSTGFEIYGTLTNITNLAVCLNSTYPYYTIGYGELKYKKTGYTDRSYYIFQNTRSTIPAINITLYYLQNALATSFQVVAESTTLDPYKDKYIQLLRWYPNLNTYNTVEMGETDETGSTVVRVKAEDVDYRIGLYELNGTLIKLAEPIRMVCLTSPCAYTLRVSPADIDYTSFLGIQSALEYDETTEIWLFTYNDPSQRTSEMNLTIYKDTGTNRITICSSKGTGYTGAISCDTTGYVGTLRGEVVRSASPGVVIAQKIVQVGANAFKSKWGLWLSFLLALPIIAFLSMISPVAAVIGGVIALIPALYLGSISITILGGILILGGLVIHFIKRVN